MLQDWALLNSDYFLSESWSLTVNDKVANSFRVWKIIFQVVVSSTKSSSTHFGINCGDNLQRKCLLGLLLLPNDNRWFFFVCMYVLNKLAPDWSAGLFRRTDEINKVLIKSGIRCFVDVGLRLREAAGSCWSNQKDDWPTF